MTGSPPTKHIQLEETSLPAKHNQPGETSLLVKRVKPGEPTPEDFNKPKEALKKIALVFCHVFEKTLGAAIPVVALITPVPIGMAVAGALGAAQVGFSLANERLQGSKESISTIMNELENMKATLEEYHAEQKWHSWAPSFAKVEVKIKDAWKFFSTMMNNIMNSNDENKQNYINEFVKVYSPKYVGATKTLLTYMTASNNEVTLLEDFGELLAVHVRCHENDIIQYNKFIGQLIYKGTIMNQFYEKVQNIQSKVNIDEQADIAYNASLVMFNVHKKCIIDSLKYVEKDVMERIDSKKTRQDLCNEVWSFLNKVYDKYDWMVVAYVCKHSDHHIFESLKSHVVAKFTKVMVKDGVCVAVARQVKGTQTKAATIAKVISKCVPKSVQCYKVEATLSKCQENIELQGRSIPVSETYTAVHSYTSPEAHDKHGAQEAPESDDEYSVGSPDHTSYIYTGDCKRSRASTKAHHKYVVLIKSEEEIVKKDPCHGWDCGGEDRGSCIRIEGMFLALCECKRPYYGLHCDESLEDYKRELEESLNITPVPPSVSPPPPHRTPPPGLRVADHRRPRQP